MGKNGSRKRTSFGVLFWIAAILFIAILLMFNLPTIRGVLERTDFVDVVFEERSGTPDTTRPEESGEPPSLGPADEGAEQTDPQASPDEEEPELVIPEVEAPEEDLTTPADEDRQEEEAIELDPPQPTEETGPQRTMQRNVYFILVSDDGRILAESVERTIRYESGPLTSTIEALIAGPTADDLNRGLLSLIPSGTELLSARVASGVAFLNFNEAFRFNSMGLEGLLAQLQQVVRTATQFSTVDAVQILIEGQNEEYLGGDGVYIGDPLTPQDLPN
ncbi:MAG TPA: GerMN domain-containing protein [Alkalispirochaeta sp.]|nr:GerMN domain-containing protein [Alkalispirochaeta sp.]